MNRSTLSVSELRIIEDIFEMQGGYVLDFTNPSFARFFANLGVEIEPESSGLSKRKRLRAFFDTASEGECARVLRALLEHRGKRVGDDENQLLKNCHSIVSRLEGITVVLNATVAATDVLKMAYVSELSDKAERRLAELDFEGAITVARTLLEAVLEELEQQLTGNKQSYAGNLPRQYKEVAKLLRIDDKDDQVDEGFKQIARGLVQIVNGLAMIRNMASDGHARHVKPQELHARAAVNSAKTVASFLVEVYLASYAGQTSSTTMRSTA